MHILNGNPEILNRNLTVIQLNSSNSHFNTKLNELIVTTHEKKANVVIISEANMETNEPDKMEYRASKFPDYKIEDKVTANNPKARLTMLIKKDLHYKRLLEYEDDSNPMMS